MMELRNPFRVRTSEHIDSDATFLRLFSPEALDPLVGIGEGLWDRIHFFQSAPGGGKTSLFRVFTPNALRMLYASRLAEQNRELYKALNALDVFQEGRGAAVLGVMLSCARNYATLDDLPVDPARRERLLFALMNARIMMAGLRGALALRGLSFPDDLVRLTVAAPSHGELPPRIPVPSDGRALFQWARDLERRVFEAIDSLGPPDLTATEGHDSLHTVGLLRPALLACDGEPVADRVAVMLDDFQWLTHTQRERLMATLGELRVPVGVWAAERMEALPARELLAPGATDGREYGAVNLERYWWDAKSHRFERTVMDVASRRVKLAKGLDGLDSFESCLQSASDGIEAVTDSDSVAETVRSRVLARIADREAKGAVERGRFDAWVQHSETMSEGGLDRAVEWRVLEVVVERELSHSQQTLAFGEPLPVEELKDKQSGLRSTAEFLVAREFNLPYYYGSSRLATLSTWNIEQFLALAGDLFEEVVSAEIIHKRLVPLSPIQQDRILRAHAERRWNALPRLPSGRDVQRLLGGIGRFALGVTLRPTVSYGPVTGVGMRSAERESLAEVRTAGGAPIHQRLAGALSSAVAHNLLVAKMDHSQGQKGQKWTVLYLNRWVCIHFGLPLQYGGWRPRNVSELSQWVAGGPSSNATLLNTSPS